MPARKPITILAFGDVVGRAGREALTQLVPAMREEYSPDLVLANAENLAHGIGATDKTLDECREAGIDFFTSGNHIFRKKEIIDRLNAQDSDILRPLNYPPGTPGQGARLLTIGTKKILVINVIGRVFFREDYDDPFRAIDLALKEFAAQKPDAIVIDAHCEATSEANALGWHVDGRTSLLYGTHTHVPTADAKILPQGTGYISDVGMVGFKNSILGLKPGEIVKSFLLQQPFNHEFDEHGPVQVNAILATINPVTHGTISLDRVDREVTI
ncbi:MAG: TIGR00282 family metallophosphoesterase [bacterium]|nr:TIGR00282 family metallophosphoesterase [bacterium]